MNSNKLIIETNKSYLRKSLKILPFTVLLLLFWFWVTKKLEPLIGIIAILFQAIIGIIILIIILSYIYTLFELQNNHPLAILDENGIWHKEFNFIPWDNIDHIGPYTQSGIPIETAAVYVKDLDALKKNAKLTGKMRIFWAKIFGYPAVFMHNITIPNSAIYSFARQYLN
jgi:hypothetical protein